MPIKQFADTSAVSVAYAIDSAANASELTATTFKYVPYTSEGFSISKETQESEAITSDRRPNGSKNTRGSASGSAALEFGDTEFVRDMLSLALMNEWTGFSMGTDKFITDGEDLRFFVVEKRIRNVVGGVKKNFFERYYGNLANEMSIELGSSELVSMSVDTMAAFADTDSATADVDADAGGLATTYTAPTSYEIADSANNVDNIVIKDDTGTPLEAVFSDFSLSLSNNVREQAAIGKEFAAGMAMGKVGAQLSGTIYFYDDTVLQSHLNNSALSAEFTIATKEGSFKFQLPRLKAESPSANSQGTNQDYTQSLTLNAERGTVTIDGGDHECVIAITHTPAV